MRVAFWLQHLLGIGHVRRGWLLCQAMQQAGLTPVVLYGGFPVPQIDWSGIEIRYLPPLKAADTSFSSHISASGKVITADWLEARTRQALLAFDSARPDALLTESYPFGRGVLRAEVTALLNRAGDMGIPRICSIRDILVAESRPGKHAKMAARANAGYDHILVHGDAAVIPFSASFSAYDQLQVPVTHTGYIAPALPQHQPTSSTGDDGRDEIIVSAGGGAFGSGLMRAARQAADHVTSHRWRLLMGPNLPEQTKQDLRADLPDHVIVEDARADFPSLLPHCALSISQGGYNTTLDVLSARCRALLIPNEDDGQTEQITRARLLQTSGHVHLMQESALTPDALAQRVLQVLGAPPPTVQPPRLDGADQSAKYISQIIRAFSSWVDPL
ncbi:MAG: glycosyltransferase [Alphaproteobacteria bacterium]